MTLREKIIRERLLEQISVFQIDDGQVSIFCPASVSLRLHEHLISKEIAASAPKPAIFAAMPEHEIIATVSEEAAKVEINIFTQAVPVEI